MFSVAIVSAMATAVSGCFTGVESTPKITYKDVRSNNAAVVSPEKELAARFVAQPFAQWSSGKRFYVTSPRISLALTAAPGSDAVMPQAGDTIRYSGITESVGLTGDHLVELRFGPAFGYRTNATAAELRRRGQMEVPFTVDLDLVDSVATHLVGRNPALVHTRRRSICRTEVRPGKGFGGSSCQRGIPCEGALFRRPR